MFCFSVLRRYFALFGLSLIASAAWADTVWLKNGDRLSGTIRVYDGSRLLIDTSYAGTVSLKWTDVATLETTDEMLVKFDDINAEKAHELHAGEEGQVVISNGNGDKSIPLQDIVQIQKPKLFLEDFLWKGNIDLAVDYKRAENDKDDYDIKIDTSARHGRWRHNTLAEYNREVKDGSVTTHDWNGEYALDYFFTNKWFWQGRFEYKRDYVEELERQRTIGAGPGYQFWDNELGSFSLAGLINRGDYRYTGGERDRFYAPSLKWAYNRYLVGKTIEFFTNGELSKPLSNAADYSLDSEVGLRYRVTEWASFNMKAQKDRVQGNHGNLDDTRYSLGFGIGW